MLDDKLLREVDEAAANAEVDHHRNAPTPDQRCLYGLIGDIAAAGSQDNETNPFAIAANAIAFMSASIGRGPYMAIGNTWHHCRAFTMHIGRSSRGRKGDAISLISRIQYALRELDEYAAPQVHRGGLSSREGLIFLIHDGYKEGKTEVDPIHDKRLWVVESEFANVLHQGKRDGNTLSPALRDCWDGVSLKPATKSNRLYATDPHVNLSAAITPTELHSLMQSRELTNGFANRFLMIWAERTRMVPFPRTTSKNDVLALAKRVQDVLMFCRSPEFANKDHTLVTLSDEARRLYDKLYRTELNDTSAGERITALIERRAPMLLRLAMLFALCDLVTVVEPKHIEAALAWIRFSVDSIKFVFSSSIDEVAVSETNDIATKIVKFLADNGDASRWELTAKCFNGHASKTRLDAALDELLSSNPPRITVREDRSSPGRPTKFYQLTGAKNAKNAKNEHSCGLAPDFGNCEESEESEVTGSGDELLSKLRILRTDKKPPQSHANIDSSLTSHTSHGDLEKAEIGIVGDHSFEQMETF
ncbi:MAG: DUF3987 domain-containing protein [Rhodoferax sp.]|uniref:DUF3987 domain-containing protein n=1 Tax=Rhodoferax sp. TaxID=50421 RepID=UPI001B6D6080|nr:DUF3987 domain-containing protein [Rhodoferax sp.]MBP9904870.1 DUF3987 domain-containing protein [Rhodoferax sp.]